MGNHELEMLADHLGHSTNIHTTVYKLQSNLLQRSKVAKILCAVEKGLIHRYKEKVMLEDLDIDSIPLDIVDESEDEVDKDTKSHHATRSDKEARTPAVIHGGHVKMGEEDEYNSAGVQNVFYAL